MKLHSLFAIAALASGASAQAVDELSIPFNGPIEYLGTYDLATGTLTPAPAGSIFAVSPDVVYDNACFANNQAFYQVLPTTDTRLDAGRMPSTSSTAPVGILNSYFVSSFAIGYITSEDDPVALGGPGASISISFWQDYDDCQTLAAAGAPQATYVMNGLPGTLTTGTLRGILIDVAVPAAIGVELLADAEGSYQGVLTSDTFGYGYKSATQTAGKTTGLFRAGGPPPAVGACTIGDGTYYQNPGVTIDGAGLDNGPLYVRDTSGTSTCFTATATPTPATTITTPHGGYFMEITSELEDCDADLRPDAAQIKANPALDANTNGILDSCEGPPPPTNYCTAGTTTNGCLAAMSATGVASAAATSGFTLNCSMAEGAKQGIIFYGNLGPNASPWINGLGQGNSFLCVKAPTQRTGSTTMSGTINMCDGAMSIDFLAYGAANPGAVGVPFASGQTYDAQCWFRDPPSPKTTNLSDGIHWTMLP